tara:strand:+ start:75 stop:389 length:315 start_codon:yes stop_codon:yes gene_type:complete
MSVKLAIFQDREQIIAEIKELVDDGKPVGYLLSNPHRVYAEKKYDSEVENRQIQVTLSPWILLTSDKEILVPKQQIVTIVEPIDSVKKMYAEKLDGSDGASVDE